VSIGISLSAANFACFLFTLLHRSRMHGGKVLPLFIFLKINYTALHPLRHGRRIATEDATVAGHDKSVSASMHRLCVRVSPCLTWLSRAT
jgi:hypothetical protein